jgi:hypothetical protein
MKPLFFSSEEEGGEGSTSTRPQQRRRKRKLLPKPPVFVGWVRENALDRCVCNVKDCLWRSYGYPVLLNGTATSPAPSAPSSPAAARRTELCIRRREAEEAAAAAADDAVVVVRAHITDPVSCVMQTVRENDFLEGEHRRYLRQQLLLPGNATGGGAQLSSLVSYEELFGFQFEDAAADDALRTAVGAWTAFLEPHLRDRLNATALADYLSSRRGARKGRTHMTKVRNNDDDDRSSCSSKIPKEGKEADGGTIDPYYRGVIDNFGEVAEQLVRRNLSNYRHLQGPPRPDRW